MLVYVTPCCLGTSLLDLHERVINDVGKFGAQPTAVKPYSPVCEDEVSGQEWIFMLVGNRLMKLYGGSTYNPKIYVGDFCLGDTEKLIAGDDSMVVLTNNPTLTAVSNGCRGGWVYQNTHTRGTPLATAPVQTYRTIPLGQATVQSYSFSGFNPETAARGNKDRLPCVMEYLGGTFDFPVHLHRNQSRILSKNLTTANKRHGHHLAYLCGRAAGANYSGGGGQPSCLPAPHMCLPKGREIVDIIPSPLAHMRGWTLGR